jgi:succinate-acetate transporter protein
MKFELTQMKKLPFVFLVAFTLLVSLTVQAQNEKETYPKITGFVGIIHPLVTLTSSDITTNFKDYYTVGMPIGINIWKNDKIG